MNTASPGMETIGQRLKKAREARGIPIEEAAYATRIRVHYLLALEEDDYSSLPSPVQGRGFLRSYAAFLGVVIQPEAQPAPEDATPTGSSPNPEMTPAVTAAAPAKGRSFFHRRPGPETPPTETTPQSAVTAAAVFQQIGHSLRQRREALNLSLGDVEQYTHLRLYYLQALETGAIDRLPSPVQGRGMLSNYAKFLNLNVDEALLKYAEGLQLRRLERLGPEAPHHPETQQASYPAFRRIISLDLVVGIVLVVILAVFIIWSITQVATTQNGANTLLTLPPVSEVLGATATLAALPTGSLSAPVLTSSTAETLTTVPLSQATPLFTVLPTGQAAIQLYIVSRQEAWVRVTVDGKVVFTGRMLPGNAYPFAGTQQIELLTGSAAALQVFYNQTDMGSLGLVGQVVDLIFTTQGLVQPTSTPAPTPTKTVPITLTPRTTGTPGTGTPQPTPSYAPP